MSPILIRAVIKAAENGWNPAILSGDSTCDPQTVLYWLQHRHLDDLSIMFDQSFARALWGDEMVLHKYAKHWDSNIYDPIYRPAWQYHIMQLAAAEDREKYLQENM